MGQLQSKGSSAYKPQHASNVHLREKKDLAGVGIIFRKGTDGTLVVKEVVGGSSAEECMQIEAGDTLTQVDDIKISKVSIAEVSGMILGEPSAPVKLKFTRTVGKSKKKYKVMLKRNVRATLEPTYRVQRDGVNTKVTHIHLDCLQAEEEGGGEQQQQVDKPGKAVRDVLDASGNVVGPGLLQRRTASMPTTVPGVERLGEAHPAHPNSKNAAPRTTTVHHSSSMASMQAGAAQPLSPKQPLSPNRPKGLPTLAPQSPQQQAQTQQAPIQVPGLAEDDDRDTNDLLDQFMFGTGGGDLKSPPSNIDSGYKEHPTDNLVTSMPSIPASPPMPSVKSPAASPSAEPKTSLPTNMDFMHASATVPQIPSMQDTQPQADAGADVETEEEEEEEEEEDTGEPDWAGLAESRVLAFEAKGKAAAGKEEKKAVDLEKEWARTAAAKQAEAAAAVKQAEAAAAAKQAATKQAEAAAAAKQAEEARLEQAAKQADRAPSPPRAPSPAPQEETPKQVIPVKAALKPLSDEPIKSNPVVLKPAVAPKKLSTKGGGGGDLAAMMAARKKQMDDNEDEGYYF